MRQVVLNNETTGLQPEGGDRLVEIAGLELMHRTPTGIYFHHYLNPERPVDPMALALYGFDDEFLSRQPRFADVADQLLRFIEGAELILHNATFDVSFINHEFEHLGDVQDIADRCSFLDTLELARRLHPGQPNHLDALARRYGIDSRARDHVGCLGDVRILAQIYLAMTDERVDA